MPRAFALALRAAALTALALHAPALGAQQFPKTPPAPLPVTAAQMPPFGSVTLPNGLRLLVVPNAKLPVLSMTLAFQAGSVHDPAGKEGLAEVVAGLLSKGAGARDADGVATAIEGVGGSFSATAGTDFLTATVSILSENAALGFELLADAVTQPKFADKEIELNRTQAQSALRLAKSQPAQIASEAFARELFGAHPYGRHASPESVKGLTRADIVAYHGRMLRPGGALLVLAGDITLAKAQAMATKAFAAWTGAAPAAPAPVAMPERATTEIVLVHRPGSVQSNVIVGNRTWLPSDPRNYAAVVANNVLGGGSDSRLFMTLREKKGWTYGAYSSLTRQKQGGYFSATAEVRTEVTDSSITELLAQLRRIRTEPIPAAEFDAAKGALVGRFPLQVETAAQVASQVASSRLHGLAADYVQTYRQKVAAVTPATAQAAAQAAMRPDAALIVVVGDGAKLYDKLAAIAPVRLVNTDGATMKPADLTAKSAALALALDRLAPRSDSFTVFVQGNPFGFQRSRIERAGTGWKAIEDTQLGPFLQQHTEVSFDATATVQSVLQTGKVQGIDTRIDVTYAGGRAKGSAATPQPPGGVKTVQVDAEMPAGALDDNAIQPLLPTFRWSAGAKYSFTAFQSGKGTALPVTLAVTGEESVVVPAGTFAAWKVDLTGGEQTTSFWIEKAAPYRVVKIAVAGAPIEVRLAK
jgi:predicted Zn-dependent peptidase